MRHLQIVVTVTGLQIFVLEERGGRKNDVGVVGSVGEELLVDDREQVRADQPANHFVVIGTYRRGIGVVYKKRFDRRPIQFVQRLPELNHVYDARRTPQRFVHQLRHGQGSFVQSVGIAGR